MRRRYHLHLPFLVYCGLTVLVAVAAINGGSNLLFWVFGAMASALLVSGLLSGVMLLGLSVRRLLPAHGVVGEPMSVRYAIRNRSRLLPAFNLHCREHASPGESGWQDRIRGGLAWIMHIGPRELVHAEAIFWPTARGVVDFDDVEVRTSFPFGILGKSIVVTRPHGTLVFPPVLPLRQRVLDAIVPAADVGMKITQHPGAGDDYYGIRELRPGDSLRHIAWKRTANRDQLLCVERTRPNPPKLRVMLNLSRAPAEDGDAAAATRRRREELAIILAASIVEAADASGLEVGLSVLGLATAPIPPRRSHWHRNKIMAALAEIDLDQPRLPALRSPAVEMERIGVAVVHPGRADLAVAREDAWHFTTTQMHHLVDRTEAELATLVTPAAAAEAAS
ncbi:MAG: DUF58 domain-containing protein [Phycisphaerales bacterium]|nr:DUF58 domain-containing protein [Phycisphaerae bacterium]NNF42546.1 DUF58 domain-containing protein [Phycisphaerales bacterium]NNM25088.1 DUF58 domain-containing protein [Phycisphaerales bacterium]